jgi:copper chaperone NosL
MQHQNDVALILLLCMKKLSNTSRLIIATGSVALIIVYFLPFWSIYLIAPQYPEGLSMQIWLYQITGQVDIINGLNHYIGMKHIKAEMFPEFEFLGYVFGTYILTGFAVAIFGSRKFLIVYLGLLLLGAVAALIDFYMWGYDYGHNLDPTAAIQVPGFSYQPPLIGHKKLLNFDAYSYPDSGGWIVIAVFALFFITLIIEWKRNSKKQSTRPFLKNHFSRVTAVAAMVIFLGCNPKSEPIVLGKDACAECKMTIADPRFGGEIVTTKAKVYKFDDVHCIAAFLKNRGVELSDIHQTLFVNYDNSAELIKVSNAEFVLSSQLKSPMNGNAAAFRGKSAAEKKSAQIAGSKVTNWATLYNVLIK